MRILLFVIILSSLLVPGKRMGWEGGRGEGSRRGRKKWRGVGGEEIREGGMMDENVNEGKEIARERSREG